MRWVHLRFVQTAFGAALLTLTSVAAGAQDFSKLSCPLLAELRMELLVRFGYCPADRYYLQLFRDTASLCDSDVPEFQIEEMILSGTAKDVLSEKPPQEEDINRLQNLLQHLRRRKCSF